MKEQEKQLKPGEYHPTRNQKALAVVSGALIGGGIGMDIAFPGHGIEFASTVHKFRLSIDLASALTAFGGASGLWGAFGMSFEAGKASSEEKK